MFVIRVKWHDTDYYVFTEKEKNIKDIRDRIKGINRGQRPEYITVNMDVLQFQVFYDKTLEYDKIYEFKQLELK